MTEFPDNVRTYDCNHRASAKIAVPIITERERKIFPNVPINVNFLLRQVRRNAILAGG